MPECDGCADCPQSAPLGGTYTVESTEAHNIGPHCIVLVITFKRAFEGHEELLLVVERHSLGPLGLTDFVAYLSDTLNWGPHTHFLRPHPELAGFLAGFKALYGRLYADREESARELRRTARANQKILEA